MQLTDEERAAARRYRIGNYDRDGDSILACLTDEGDKQMRADAFLLAAAMLRLFPEDDQEPVTEKWLLSIGFVLEPDGPGTDTGWVTWKDGDCPAVISYQRWDLSQCKIENDEACGPWVKMEKRGDVLRLLALTKGKE